MIGHKGMRRWLARGFGLRARMTASYVLVTFAAVVVVEALAGLLVLPNVNQQIDLGSRVVITADTYVKQYGAIQSGRSGAGVTLQQLVGQQQLGVTDANLGPGQERAMDHGLLIPYEDRQLPDTAPMSLALVLDPLGVITASSYPGRYPIGASALDRLPRAWQDGGSAVDKLLDGMVAWASEAIMSITPDPESPDIVRGKPIHKNVLGYVYVQVPVPATSAPDPSTIT